MVSRRTILISGVTLLGAAALPGVALAETADIYVTSDNIAINGYDPVAYFTQEDAVEGSVEFFVEWNGATWHFASEQNRDMFEAEPEKYAPKYGGYCAFAVSQGAFASTDPKAWTIVDERLYLNFSLRIRDRWRKDMEKYIAQADNNWPGVLRH